MDNEEGWRRLAEAVRRRRDERNWTQLDVATRGSLSIDRVQAVEGARTDRYSARTLSKLERALEWEPGSVRATLTGGAPTPAEAPPAAPTVKQANEEELTTAELIARAEELMAQANEYLRRARGETG